jgi:hypothetical protein
MTTKIEKKKLGKTQLLHELMQKQRKEIPEDKKIYPSDMKRICKNITSSIFDKTNCCQWEGYITNLNKVNKGTYVNFYYGGKKVALHRLLYINFVEDLSPDEYLKFNCENKGSCCNVYHLKKFKYNKTEIQKENKKETKKKISITSNYEGKDTELTIDFS